MHGDSRSPEVAVAVVSWNTRELLLRCLSSLESDARLGRVHVWVVDNGSADGSAGAARAYAPWATVLEPGSNLGFGRAVNLVAAQSRTPWLLAANADVALTPGALARMLAAGGEERVGAVAPQLELPGGSAQHSVHPFPTVPFTLAFNLGLFAASRRLRERYCLEGSWDPAKRRVVPWAIGACVLIRRAAFEALGGFDEQQWMYAEDLDLGWRLRQHGWVTYYEPSARVLHDAGAAAMQAFGADRSPEFMAATYAVLRRRRGAARAWATAAINLVGAAARLPWNRRQSRRWLNAHRFGLRTLRRHDR